MPCTGRARAEPGKRSFGCACKTSCLCGQSFYGHRRGQAATQTRGPCPGNNQSLHADLMERITNNLLKFLQDNKQVIPHQKAVGEQSPPLKMQHTGAVSSTDNENAEGSVVTIDVEGGYGNAATRVRGMRRNIKRPGGSEWFWSIIGGTGEGEDDDDDDDDNDDDDDYDHYDDDNDDNDDYNYQNDNANQGNRNYKAARSMGPRYGSNSSAPETIDTGASESDDSDESDSFEAGHGAANPVPSSGMNKLYTSAKIFMVQGDTKNAALCLEKFLVPRFRQFLANPRDRVNFYVLARLHMENGDLASARTVMENVYCGIIEYDAVGEPMFRRLLRCMYVLQDISRAEGSAVAEIDENIGCLRRMETLIKPSGAQLGHGKKNGLVETKRPAASTTLTVSSPTRRDTVHE